MKAFVQRGLGVAIMGLMWIGFAGCEGDDDNASDSPSVPTTWEPGRSLAGIFLGDSFATVKSRLGEPNEIRVTEGESDSPASLWTDYDTVGLSFSYDDRNGNGLLDNEETAEDLFANDGPNIPRYQYEGITFGSSFESAVQVLGEPSDLTGGVGADGFGNPFWLERGLGLIFSGNAVTMIFIFEPIHGLGVRADDNMQRAALERVRSRLNAYLAR